MIGPLYRLLYTRLGGRPFTYRIRDAWRQEPTSFLFLFLGLGMLLGRYLPEEALWWVLGALAAGIVLGHLFWPTNYGVGRRKNDGE